MKKNENGFSAVELVIILVVVGALVGAGWLVYSRRSDKDNQTAKSASSQSSTAKTDTTSISNQSTEASVDKEAQAWLLVQSGQKGFSIRIPDGWAATNYMQDNDLRAQSIDYKQGTQAKITEFDGSYAGDGGVRFSVKQFKADDNYKVVSGDEQKQDFKLGDITGSRYYIKYPVKAAEGIGPYPGQETYTYEFKKGTTTTYVTYSIYNLNEFTKGSFSKSDANQVDLVERAVKTLTIN